MNAQLGLHARNIGHIIRRVSFPTWPTQVLVTQLVEARHFDAAVAVCKAWGRGAHLAFLYTVCERCLRDGARALLRK